MIYLCCEQTLINYIGDYCEALKNLSWNYTWIVYSKQIPFKTTMDLIPKSQLDSNPDFYIFFQNLPNPLNLNLNLTRMAIINTEQLTRFEWFSLIQKYIHQGLTVFDYDLYQSQIFGSKHIYLPYPIINKEDYLLTQLYTEMPKPYDVVLCASMSPRRQLIYDQLISHGLKVLNVRGTELIRDQDLARGKILLNVRYDEDYQIFEHLRCDRWIMAGHIIVNEEGLSDDKFDFRSLIYNYPYSRLVQEILKIVSNYDKICTEHALKLKLVKSKLILNRLNQCQEALQTWIKSYDN